MTITVIQHFFEFRENKKTPHALPNESYTNSEFTYLADLIAKSSLHAMRQFHVEICHLHESNLRQVKYLAAIGHLAIIPNYKFGSENFRASLAGDIVVLYVWKKFIVFGLCSKNQLQFNLAFVEYQTSLTFPRFY